MPAYRPFAKNDQGQLVMSGTYAEWYRRAVRSWLAAGGSGLVDCPAMTSTTRGPVLIILFAGLMARAGNGISIVAFPWLVLQRNSSAMDASLVAMAGTLPLAGVDAYRRGRRRLHRTPPGVDDRRWAIRALRHCGPGDRADLRRRRGRRRGARDARGARLAVRPGGHDGPRVDAARGGQAGRLDARPRQQRLRGGLQPGRTSSGPASAAC